MTEYNIFWVSPGQMSPSGGATSIMVPGTNGGIIWKGEDGTFPTTAALGTKLPGDKTPATTYNYRPATKQEILWYEDFLANPPKMDEDI